MDSANYTTTAQKLEQQLPNIDLNAGTTIIDRALRLVSNTKIKGRGPYDSTLVNQTASQPWGDSATVQALQGWDFGIGYVDPFSGGTATILVPESQARNYTTGTLAWTWKWVYKGTPIQPPTRHKVIAVNKQLITLDKPPLPGANAIAWTRGGLRPIRPNGATDYFTTRDDVNPLLIGQIVLISDGQRIANEARGEFRRVIEVAPGWVRLDSDIEWLEYHRDTLIVAPVNVVENATVRSLALGAGPSGFSFYGKHLYNLQFINCRFEGVCEINQSGKIVLINCTGTHLKLNCVQDAVVSSSGWSRITFEEGCNRILINDNNIYAVDQKSGISTDPDQQCHNITIRNTTITGKVNGSPIALEGNNHRVENCVVRCQPSDGHIYMTGNKATVIGLESDRGLVFKSGLNQVAHNVSAPGVSFGWDRNTDSEGVASNIDSPSITNTGNWIIK